MKNISFPIRLLPPLCTVCPESPQGLPCTPDRAEDVVVGGDCSAFPSRVVVGDDGGVLSLIETCSSLLMCIGSQSSVVLSESVMSSPVASTPRPSLVMVSTVAVIVAVVVTVGDLLPLLLSLSSLLLPSC